MDNAGNGDFTIYVNKRKVRVSGTVLDASEILTSAGFDPGEYSLFLIHSQAGGGGAGPGQAGGGGAGPGQAGGGGAGPGQIGPGQTIEMCDGLHFHAILKSVPYG